MQLRNQFNVGQRDGVPSCPTMLKWFNNIRTRGTVRSVIARGGVHTVRTPENIRRTSPGHSAVQHTRALHISDMSVHRILHLDLHFHPYKIMVVHKLQHTHYVRPHMFAERTLETLENDSILIMSDGLIFTYWVL
ncbi:hypothetical protein C0J52_11331 [Blattella germanica]|nr:hypothetical protein C0J52_11331 [Blattella germanica]